MYIRSRGTFIMKNIWVAKLFEWKKSELKYFLINPVYLVNIHIYEVLLSQSYVVYFL